MACQSGIRVSGNSKLLKFFNDCKSGNVRVGKVVIKNEELSVNFQDKGSNDWRCDFKKFIPNCIDAFEPCFILFRIDLPTSWILISFADDRAPVREKMVLASTRATFKAEFGQSNIRQEYHVTNKNEMTLDAFEQWILGKEEPGPMSDLEKEMNSAQHEQNSMLSSAVATAQTLKGVFFPVDQDAEGELRKLANNEVNYVQLAVDTLNEAIKLEVSKFLESTDQLSKVIPRDKPRYHFYRFSHNYNDEECNSLFFIYSMPSSGCTIKERMLYSSCKQPFLQSALSGASVHPDKKIEIDSKEALSYDILFDYLHPKEQDQNNRFARPPGPSQRKARRVTKAVG